MNWNASEFWIDGGCLGNEAHGRREAYGSISDGEAVERFQFVDAQTNNEAEYSVLLVLLRKLPDSHDGPQKLQTCIHTDSRLLFGQLTQGWKVKAQNLLPMHEKAAMQLRRTGANLIWTGRPEIMKRLGH